MTTSLSSLLGINPTTSASTLPSQTGNTGKYLTTDGGTASWATVAGGLVSTAVKTASYTAAANDLVRVNATSSFNITMPASPVDGVTVGIIDIGTTFGTNNITILPGAGATIEGDTSVILDINSSYAAFTYIASTTNWRLLTIPSSGTGSGGSLSITTLKAANYTAAAGELVRANTVSGSFNLTLPATPSDGATVGVLDVMSTFSTNALTILPSVGATIEGETSFGLDISHTYAEFIYSASTTNWMIKSTPSSANGGLSVSTIKSFNYTAIAGDLIRANTLGGSFNITLPAAPFDGATIGILDISSSFGTYPITVLSGFGDYIESDTAVVLDLNHTYAEFIYSISTSNWLVKGTPNNNNNLVNSILDDISNQFDGATSVFNLTTNSIALNTIIDSKDLEVFVNGLKLSPYVDQVRYPWITPYDSATGFRVKSNQLILYKAPFIGSMASLTVRSTSSSRQTQKYPFNAMTIALGD